MAVYKYKAISQNGETVKGFMEADDQYEAVSRIKETCSVVLAISETASVPGGSRGIFGAGRISEKELSLLCYRFAIILKTGLPLVRAVDLIREQVTNRKLKDLLAKVAGNVAEGHGLAQSLEHMGGKILPITFIETIRAGEESGTMVTSFQRLAAYYDKSAKTKSKVRSAMLYPIFLAFLAAAVIAVVIIFTIPAFTVIFEDMGIEMPALTKAIVRTADFVAHDWWFAGIVVAGLAWMIRIWTKTDKGQMTAAKAGLCVPVIGRINRMKGASQFANTFSTLLAAGVPLIQTIRITARTLDNRYLGHQLALIVPMLEGGCRLGEELKKCTAFPAMLCEMTAMGEETGTIEETLEIMGAYYDSEIQIASERALAMLQPAIILVMGIIIGFIVIGLYLPIFTMYTVM